MFSQENFALNYIFNSSISLHIYLNLVDTKAKTATTEHVEHVQLKQKYKKRSSKIVLKIVTILLTLYIHRYI